MAERQHAAIGAGVALAVHQIEIGGAALGAAGDDTVGNAGDGGVEVSHNLKTARPELVDGPFFLATPIKGLPLDKLRARSEESSVGKECASKCRSRWSPYHSKTKDSNKHSLW